MDDKPTADEIARWDRWFAIEMNGRAWTLVEKAVRSPLEDEEMLHAAHAAALHWSRVGSESNRARADMLLGQVHALLGNGSLAMHYARRSHDFTASRESPDWELAFVHAVLANAARAAQDAPLYAEEYRIAKKLGGAIADSEDREIFERTFALLPAPAA